MSLIFVKTASGSRRRHPSTWKVLPSIDDAEAAPVQIDDGDPHWYRALRCGDIVETDEKGAVKVKVDAKAATSAATPAPAAASPTPAPAAAAPAVADAASASAPSGAATAAPAATKSA